MERLARDEKRKRERALTTKWTSYTRTGASAGEWDKHSFRIMVGDWTASSSVATARVLEVGQTRLSRSAPGRRGKPGRKSQGWTPESAIERTLDTRERRISSSILVFPSSLPLSLSHTHLPRNCNASWKWSRDTPAVSSMSLPRKPPRGKRASNRERDETARVEWSRDRLAIFQRPQY